MSTEQKLDSLQRIEPGGPIPAEPSLSIQPAIPTPMAILARAVELGRPIDELSKLMDLQERWERNEAKKAFVTALAAFKADPPKLEKNKKVSITSSKGDFSYKYAGLEQVTTIVGARLAKYGLSMRWTTGQADGKIRVTCILQHEMGHSEETTLEAPPDNSGAKNEIQAMGSTVAYLQRYTGLPSVGLAAADDTDGITFTKAEEMLNSIASAADLDELQERYNKWFKLARNAKDRGMMSLVVESKDRRKDELSNPKILEFRKLADAKGLNSAARTMLLGKHSNDYEKATAELKGLPDPPNGVQGDPETAGKSMGTNSADETKAEPAKKGRGKKAPPEEAKPTPPAKDPEWGF